MKVFAALIMAGFTVLTARSSKLPASRREADLRKTLCHGAYRTHEYSGLIFAYMGPPEEEPASPGL